MNLDKRLTEAAKKVARLEGELAEVTGELIATLLNMAQVVGERDTAQAAIRAKDAALREHGCDFVYPSPVRQPAPCLEHWGDNSAEAKEQWCSTCTALSDAGKGWLPPEAKLP